MGTPVAQFKYFKAQNKNNNEQIEQRIQQNNM